jgi:two-component system sensor histidine kinase VanS
MTLFIDGIFQDPFAEGFVTFCKRILSFSDEEARYRYRQIFRNYKYVWMAIGYFIILLFIFYQALSRLTRYFNEVSSGINQLVEEKNGDIRLSQEMEFIEKKLNTVKNTLEKRAHDAQEAEQRKNDLVVYLAHDIKTPLTSVIGYLSLLEEAQDMPIEQKAKYVKITLDKAYRLEQLINEFFEITRFNLQTIIIEKQEIKLPYMLMQMADEFYPTMVLDGKTAEVEAQDNLILYGDADKLARVFNNIMKNAIAYSSDNSTIQISAKKIGKEIVITFTNQGNDIPAGKLETIFDKFYRLDNARSSNTGGAGLGLAIAKNIVNAHGGSITADSKEGRTIFTVKLPD